MSEKLADIIVEVDYEPETHVQVISIQEGVVVVPGMLYGNFFAFDPARVRFHPFAEEPELRSLRRWIPGIGFEWNDAQVQAFVRQEVGCG